MNMDSIMVATAWSAGVLGSTLGGYLAPQAARFVFERALGKRATVRRTVVLTYDDGPGLYVTPRLLDLLATCSAKASFFLLGAFTRGTLSDPATHGLRGA